MNEKRIVLENSLGQIVRTFQSGSEPFDLILNLTSGRLSALPDHKLLDPDETPYRLLCSVDPKNLGDKGLKVEGYGSIKLLSDREHFSKNLSLIPETDQKYKQYLALSAAIHCGVVFLILSIGFLFQPVKKYEPTEVVLLQPRKSLNLAKKKVTTVVRKKVRRKVKKAIPKKRKVVAKKKSSRRQSLVRRPKRSRVNKAKSKVALQQRGALAALGSLTHKSKKQGGVNINKVKTSFGAGLGGSGGSGGVQTSVYSKGLVAAPTGRGQKIRGAGGYGTKGKGGGKAGYGRMTLAGGSSAYFKPLTSQALVQGGLERSQVAAVIQRHLGQVRYCYEKGLQSKPNLRGRLKMKFTINGRGRVSVANVGSSSVNDRSVETCITKKLRSWKFPRPVGNVDVKVSYPFVLNRVSKS